MKPLYPLLIYLSFMFAAMTVPAQDTPDEEMEATATETKQQQEQPADKIPETEVEIQPTPDTFKPSQEISEDLSVSYPVDI